MQHTNQHKASTSKTTFQTKQKQDVGDADFGDDDDSDLNKIKIEAADEDIHVEDYNFDYCQFPFDDFIAMLKQ